MGIFGDKDLKRLEREVLALRIAVELSSKGLVQDVPRLEAGVNNGVRDIVALMRRLREKGKGSEADAMLRKLHGGAPEAQESLTTIRNAIDGELAHA
jgi:hypothetical protein